MYFPLQIKKFLYASTICYQTYPVHGPLQKDIAYFWNLKSVKPVVDFNYVILPDACIDFVFDYSSCDKVHVFVSAPFTKAETIRLSGSFNYWGIRFYPGKVIKYLDILTSDLREPFTDLEAVSCNAFLNDIEEQDFLSTIEKRLETTAMFSHTSATKRLEDVFANWLGGDLEYSNRHIQRMVNEATGINPITLRKIIRLQNVLSGRYDFYSQYYDQAHYSKNFKTLTGFTPGSFYKQFAL